MPFIFLFNLFGFLETTDVYSYYKHANIFRTCINIQTYLKELRQKEKVVIGLLALGLLDLLMKFRKLTQTPVVIGKAPAL